MSTVNRIALNHLNAEVEAALRKLRAIPEILEGKQRDAILRPAAQILESTAKQNIRNATKTVKRYATAKGSKKIKAPKGRGQVVATYEPGNLKIAMRILKFRRSQALFVGPKVMKRNPAGTFGKGRRADGWYAHFVEFGTRRAKANPYMRPAVATSGRAVQKRIIWEVTMAIRKWTLQNRA